MKFYRFVFYKIKRTVHYLSPFEQLVRCNLAAFAFDCLRPFQVQENFLYQASQFRNPDSFYKLISISTIRFKKSLKEGLEFFIFEHLVADIRKRTASRAQYPRDRVDILFIMALKQFIVRWCRRPGRTCSYNGAIFVVANNELLFSDWMRGECETFVR